MIPPLDAAPRPRRPGSVLAVLTSALALAACTAPPAPATLDRSPETHARAPSRDAPAAVSGATLPSIAAATEVFGTSVEGRPLVAQRRGSGEDLVLLIATIHGDEAAGTPLLERLLQHLDGGGARLDGLTVVIVPVANPDGLAHGKRLNARRVDLNRNFPSANFRGRARHGSEPLSEPESRALFELIGRSRPRRVVSIHQPVAVIDYDGPAAALAARMAAASDLPVKRIGSRPGSLGSYVGVDLGIPIVTLELPAAASRLDPGALWKHYGPMLLAAIAGD